MKNFTRSQVMKRAYELASQGIKNAQKRAWNEFKGIENLIERKTRISFDETLNLFWESKKKSSTNFGSDKGDWHYNAMILIAEFIEYNFLKELENNKYKNFILNFCNKTMKKHCQKMVENYFEGILV